MEHRVAPELLHARDRRPPVAHPRGQQKRPRPDAVDLDEVRLGPDHRCGCVADLNAVQRAELRATGCQQLQGRRSVLAEQAADRVRRRVARRSVVEDERASPRAPQHERRAESRRPAPDDHDLEVHAGIVPSRCERGKRRRRSAVSASAGGVPATVGERPRL